MANAKLYLATYPSTHFDFDGVGVTEAEAINVCKQGLRAHARQYKIEDDWWWRDFRDSERAPDIDALFSVRVIERGGAYRDGSEIPTD